MPFLGTAPELSGTLIGSPPAMSSFNLGPTVLPPGVGRVEENSLTWGLGLTYRLSANLRARTEWERLDDGLNVFGAGLQLNWKWSIGPEAAGTVGRRERPFTVISRAVWMWFPISSAFVFHWSAVPYTCLSYYLFLIHV